MSRIGKLRLPLILVGLATAGLLSSRVDAQHYRREYKSGWYVDPVLSSPSSVLGSNNASAYPLGSQCPSGEIPRYATETDGGYGTAQYSDRTGTATNLPLATNALLRVWVDECASVWVNGQLTKPQRLAGVHGGSRIFSLTGLTPNEIQVATIEVRMMDGQVLMPITKPVQAGGSYEVRFVSQGEVDFVPYGGRFKTEPARPAPELIAPELPAPVRTTPAAPESIEPKLLPE